LIKDIGKILINENNDTKKQINSLISDTQQAIDNKNINLLSKNIDFLKEFNEELLIDDKNTDTILTHC